LLHIDDYYKSLARQMFLEGYQYGGANKSLARPERKQATATKDFDFHISYL